MKSKLWLLRLPFSAVLLLGAARANAAIVYTSDATLGDFTAGMIFGTFTSAPGGADAAMPFTPTVASIAGGLRFFGTGAAGPVTVVFTSPVSTIRVFPNIDHFGAAYDGYQYTISGSNDGVTYTPLFDALTVAGGAEPFTLGTFTGPGPTRVNNVLTTPAGPGGAVGYEADFSFGTAYKFYSFGPSTEAIVAGNIELEFSAIEIGRAHV